MIKIGKIAIILVVVSMSNPLFCFGGNFKMHPINKQLIKLGILSNPPRYCPEIPRITAEQALAMYYGKRALFVLISYKNKDLIVGGLHFTEGEYKKINPNKLPLLKGQILVLY